MMRLFLTLFQISVLLTATLAFEKEWKWKNEWNVGEFWIGGKIPCPNDVVVISDGTIFVNKNVTASGLNFGNGGEIVFGDNTEIELTNDAPIDSRNPDESHCDGTTSEATFIGTTQSKDWLNPLNWEIRKDGVINEDLTMAAPYMNRIPCREDRVVFAMSDTFKVNLTQEWKVKEFMINKELLTNNEVKSYIQSNPDEFVMTNQNYLVVDNYPCARSGCLCGYQQYQESICKRFTCPVPTTTAGCSSSVRPHGDCCNRCGKLITFDVLNTFDFQKCWEVYESEMFKNIPQEVRPYVKFYMIVVNGNQVQVVLTEVESMASASTSATKLAVNALQSTIKQGISVCLGMNLIVDSGKEPGTKDTNTGGDGGDSSGDDNSGLKIALGILIPVILLIVIILIVFAYRRKREPYDVPKVRFKNNEALVFPGGAEGQYSTMGNTNIDIESEGATAYSNPTYETNDDTSDGIKKHELREFPYEIPLDDEPPPSYTEKDYMGVTEVGDVSQMYARVNKDNDVKEKVEFPDDDVSSIYKEPIDEDAFLKPDDISTPPSFDHSVVKLDDDYRKC